jgi:bifunctional DNA-binding transcriptional regulator/antitoxin component of YhaV-PrlF toxin-antitoxin module
LLLPKNKANGFEQCICLWQAVFMSQSTITDKFQTTIPVEVRQALKLSPRQRVSYELRPDGSAILSPVPNLDQLFGSVRLGRRAASPRVEKEAARSAMARAASRRGPR